MRSARLLVWLLSWSGTLPSCSAAAHAPQAVALSRLTSLLTQRQSSDGRAAVEEAIAELTASAAPNAEAHELNGRWRLQWSSQTADVNPFAMPDSVLGGACFQEIDLSTKRVGRLSNVVEWAPRWRLIGGAAVEPGGTRGRNILNVDSAVIELGGAKLDFSLSSFAKLIDRTKRERSESEGTGAGADDLVGRGWLECIYVDETLRVSRDNTGFLYVHSRVLDDSPGAPAAPLRRAGDVQLCATDSSAQSDDEAEDAAPRATLNATAAGLGVAGLAGSATAASVITAAGGACVGGACVAAGGVATGATAASGAGAAAGLGGAVQSLVAGGAIAIASLGSMLTGGPTATMSEGLASMVASATPIEVASASGKPTVIEFYRPACKFCNLAASSGLADVEANAKRDGVNWVMLDTDERESTRYVRKYGVSELPHFEFFAAGGAHEDVPEEGGPVDVPRIAARVAMLSSSRPAIFPRS